VPIHDSYSEEREKRQPGEQDAARQRDQRAEPDRDDRAEDCATNPRLPSFQLKQRREHRVGGSQLLERRLVRGQCGLRVDRNRCSMLDVPTSPRRGVGQDVAVAARKQMLDRKPNGLSVVACFRPDKCQPAWFRQIRVRTGPFIIDRPHQQYQHHHHHQDAASGKAIVAMRRLTLTADGCCAMAASDSPTDRVSANSNFARLLRSVVACSGIGRVPAAPWLRSKNGARELAEEALDILGVAHGSRVGVGPRAVSTVPGAGKSRSRIRPLR